MNVLFFMTFLYQNPRLKERRRALRNGSTDVERFLWKFLRGKQLDGFRFTRQYSVGTYILDFYCIDARLAIELDGGQHLEKETRIYDEERTKFLESHCIYVLRFWNNEVINNPDSVLEAIRSILIRLRDSSDYV